jgi:predicted 3-demethylubiquinone-9 3-methyltransferase (glyoxalase superfamily)
MKSITPFLWFDDDLEEAVDFYTSAFPEGKVHNISRAPDGKAFTADFEIAGQYVRGLNGGPHFQHTEAFSFFVECEGQEEVDHYWDVLTADGGEESQCGWLKDKFGVSWQIIPTEFMELMSGSAEQSERVMVALRPMRKIDIATLRAASAG